MKSIIIRRRREITCTFFGSRQSSPPQGGRGSISAWNSGMSNRLARFANNYYRDWTGMVTLTWGKQYPSDGREVKRAWRAFLERLRRTGWLEKNGLLWFLEFQARGAPHIHCLSTGWLDKEWVSEAWADVTGGDSRVCTRVEKLNKPDSAGSYAIKYARKSEQKEVPAGFTNVGRMWGHAGDRTLAEENAHERKRLHARARTGFEPSGVLVPALAAVCLEAPWELMTRVGSRGFPSVKITRTLSGYNFYGTAEEINKLWHYLQVVLPFAGRNESSRESSARKMWAGSCATPSRQENQTPTSEQRYKNQGV